jgi:hypothetical protein
MCILDDFTTNKYLSLNRITTSTQMVVSDYFHLSTPILVFPQHVEIKEPFPNLRKIYRPCSNETIPSSLYISSARYYKWKKTVVPWVDSSTRSRWLLHVSFALTLKTCIMPKFNFLKIFRKENDNFLKYY